jgi:hypothetical protein
VLAIVAGGRAACSIHFPKKFTVDFRWVGGEVDREGKARNVGRYGHFLRRAAILAGRRAGLALPYLHVPKASGGEAFMAL